MSQDADINLDDSRKFTDRDNTSIGDITESKRLRRLAHNNGMFCEVERIEKFKNLLLSLSKET